jgi:hypothetical protein
MASIVSGPGSSSTVGVARQLVELRRQRDRLMFRSLEQLALPPEQRTDLTGERLSLEARMETIEAIILSGSPVSLIEVAIQLMVALQHVDALSPDQRPDPRETAETALLLERVMVAAIRRIEAHEALDLARLGSSFYLRGRAVGENYEHLWAELVTTDIDDTIQAFRQAGEEHVMNVPSEPTDDMVMEVARRAGGLTPEVVRRVWLALANVRA